MIKIQISKTLQEKIRKGYPWIFHYQVQNETVAGKPGDLGVVYDSNNRFLAIGLFDPESDIRLRILQLGKPTNIDAAFFNGRLKQALALREPLAGKGTTGYRIVNGENDGFPGLILDRYENTAVLKLYTSSWKPYLKILLPLIRKNLPIDRCVLRWSRKAGALAKDSGGLGDGQLLFGTPIAGPVRFLEHGFSFEVDVLSGQKTGFFLDQRDNRKHVLSLSAGKSVLNVFSYTGAFSVYALAGGCRSIFEIDSNPIALTVSKRNLQLNFSERVFSSEEFDQLQGDAFEMLARLETQNKKFDLVLLDPPAFAKRKKQIQVALSAYARLVEAGTKLVSKRGILFASSCSVHVGSTEFYEAVFSGIQAAGRSYRELRRTGHALDHPATFAHGAYLKAIYCRVDS